MDTTLIEQFARVLSGPEAVITDAQARTTAGHDYWGFGGTPGLLLRPRTRDEVVAVMQLATKHQIPVVPRGGASNGCAGIMPNQDCILLDVSNMNRVLDIDVAARRARVQTGVINAALQQQLAPTDCASRPIPCRSSCQRLAATSLRTLVAHML